MAAIRTARWSAGHFLNQEAPTAAGPGDLRKFMQDQFMSRAISARSTPYSPINLKTNAPRQPATWRKPASPGLTRAQLQQIVLEQLG
jgi:hypothetical protein